MKRFAFVAFVAFALLALDASAETFAVIRGHFTDWDQSPLPGVEVTLKGGSLTKPMKTTTNAHGDFFFLAVPPARNYDVLAELPGFIQVVGGVGGVGAGESLFVNGMINTRNYSTCGSMSFSVDRRATQLMFIEPLPKAPIHYVCI